MNSILKEPEKLASGSAISSRKSTIPGTRFLRFLGYNRFFIFVLLSLSLHCFFIPAVSSSHKNYPNFEDNPLLTDRMRSKIVDYLIPLHHPIKATLDSIFSQSRVLENERTLVAAGFEILVPPLPNSYIIVARHPEVPGYVFKLHLDSETRSRKNQPHWIWLVRRCVEAKKIRKVIKHKKIRHFSVPDKWLFIPPAYPYSSAPNPQPMIVVETDMELVSYEQSELMWKTGITTEHLDELYSIIKHGYGGHSVLYLPSNIPFTKNNKFAFVDTEGPQSDGLKLKMIKKFLSKEMQKYWDTLIKF